MFVETKDNKFTKSIKIPIKYFRNKIALKCIMPISNTGKNNEVEEATEPSNDGRNYETLKRDKDVIICILMASYSRKTNRTVIVRRI